MFHPAAVAFLGLTLLAGACGRDASSPSPASGGEEGWPVWIEAQAGDPAYERVVLVTLDTLRADHVGCYGYPRATTPFLDTLAERGVRFTRALAAVSHTAPSHGTMLTGLEPAVHGVQVNGQRLDPRALDLADLFGARGYETAAFVNTGFLSGVAPSFRYVEVQAGGKGERWRRGAAVVDAARRWLREERKSERFFLWVHLYDPHHWQEILQAHGEADGPLWERGSPEDFLARLTELHGLPAPVPGQPYSVPWGGRNGPKVADSSGQFRADRFVDCIDAYDQLILYADRQVERLYAELEALGLPGRSLWIVTSDHGEGLASHGYPGHTGRIWQEQLHVPLILHDTGGGLGPRVVDDLVAHVDLLPTCAELLGLRVGAVPQVFTGRSLLGLARGASSGAPGRAVFSQRRPSTGPDDIVQGEIYALQDERWKLLRRVPEGDLLFDLDLDPRELTDLGRDHPAAAALRQALEERLGRFRDHAPSVESGETPEEWLQELRDLGYAH